MTRRLPEQLSAAPWLPDNRAAWGIESGRHQPLDIAHLDDQCRVRQPQSMRGMGMFRRLSNCLFLHCAEHHRYAIRCLHAASQASKPLRELAVGSVESGRLRVEYLQATSGVIFSTEKLQPYAVGATGGNSARFRSGMVSGPMPSA